MLEPTQPANSFDGTPVTDAIPALDLAVSQHQGDPVPPATPVPAITTVEDPERVATRPAAAAPVRAQREEDRPTLRLALAMRGGVSLAVWIGGAVAELDQLRYAPQVNPALARIDPIQWRRLVYRKMLELADFNDVEIDILAGASAGGLNAVLYGTAQSVGAPVDDMLDLWCEAGQLSKLMHHTGKRFGQVVRAPLRGDGYFYCEIYRKLAGLVAAGPTARHLLPQSHLSIGLSATLLPERVSGEPPLEPETDTGHASFSFVRRPGAAMSEVPVPAIQQPGMITERDAFLVARLALAARSTSSFPGAFERATVPSADGSANPGYRSTRGRGMPAMPNMADVFCALRTGTVQQAEPFHVTDGGVLDNIGIARALAAIAAAPATRPTTRRLLYLDPDPAKQPLTIDPDPQHTRAIRGTDSLASLLRRVFGLRLGTKTVRDDLAVLRRHNEDSRARQATRDVFIKQLATEAASVGGATLGARLTEPWLAIPAYAEYRAAADLPRLTDLLISPQRQIATQVTRGMAYATWPPGQYGGGMLQFRGPLATAYQQPPVLGTLSEDLTSLIDAADFLISWARGLQAWLRSPMPEHQSMADLVDRGALMEIKRRLYRISFVATSLRDRADRSILRVNQRQYDPTRIADYFTNSICDVLATQRSYQLPDSVLRHLSAPAGGPPTDDAAFYNDFGDYLDGLGQSVPTDGVATRPASLPPAETPWWPLLQASYQELAQLGAAITAPPLHETESTRAWRESLANTLLCHPDLIGTGGLRQLCILFAGGGGLPDSTTTVAFEAFDADVRSPLTVPANQTTQPPLAALRDATTRTWAGRIMAGSLPDLELSWLTSDTKLAGNQVANFSGFLSQRWRVNDWMWGRADAAANATRLLFKECAATYPAPTADPTPETPLAMPPETLRTANELAMMVGGTPRPQWSQQDLDELRDRVTVGLQGAIIDTTPACMTAPDDSKPIPPGGPPAVVPVVTTGMETPGVLAPAYRGRTVMSLGLLVYRAVWPQTGSILSFFGGLLLAMVRPLWTYALLFGLPGRAAFISTLLLGAIAAGDAGGPSHGTFAYSLGYGIALGTAAIVSALSWLGVVNRRAGRVRSAKIAVDRSPNTDPQALAVAVDALRLAGQVSVRQRIAAWSVTLLTMVITAVLIIAAVRDEAARQYFEFTWPEYVGAVALVISAVLWLANRGRGKLAGATGAKRRRGTPAWWLAAVVAMGAIITVHRWLPASGDDWVIAAVGVAFALTLSVASTYDWLGWLATTLVALVNAGVVVGAVVRWPSMGGSFGAVLATASIVWAVLFSFFVTTALNARKD